jgi:HSP20 family protein
MRTLTCPAGQPALRSWMNEIDRAFAEAFAPRPGAAVPAVNFSETAEAYRVEAELPGLALDQVELLVEGNRATLRGERPAQSVAADAWRRRECWHGKFERTMEFPRPLDADKAAATLKNGVLTVILPKAGASQPKRVPVVAQ